MRTVRYIKTWVDRLRDTPAFIIGNGPSLNDQPVHMLEDYFTIGINRAFLALDPTLLLWCDLSLVRDHQMILHKLKALKVSRDVSDPRKTYYNFHLKGGGYKFGTTTHILHGRGSSGPLAVQLAVAMGCRPIILLGMDCARGPDGVSDFYGENKHWTDATLKNCLQGLVFIKEQCPVEVYNCGNNDLWERESLVDVLEKIPSKHKRGRQQYVADLQGQKVEKFDEITE